MKRCKTIQELRESYQKRVGRIGYASAFIFLSQAAMYSAELLAKIERDLAAKQHRRPLSAYQKRLTRHLKEGKPIREAHRLAKEGRSKGRHE
jgi:hypothetical protein